MDAGGRGADGADRGGQGFGAEVDAEERLQRRRRMLVTMLLVMGFLLLALSSRPDEQRSDARGAGGGGGGGGGGVAPPDENTLAWQSYSRHIQAAAWQAVYPSQVSLNTTWVGEWHREREGADVAEVTPLLTPNVTVAYYVPPNALASRFPLSQATGDMRMAFVTQPIAAVPHIQYAAGHMLLHDGDSEARVTTMSVPFMGLYVADEGVLVGLTQVVAMEKVRVVITPVPSPPPPAPSGTATPTASPTDDGDDDRRLLSYRQLPEAGTGVDGGGAVPSTPPTPAPMCRMAFMLRMRPMAYVEHAAGSEDGGGRMMQEAAVEEALGAWPPAHKEMGGWEAWVGDDVAHELRRTTPPATWLSWLTGTTRAGIHPTWAALARRWGQGGEHAAPARRQVEPSIPTALAPRVVMADGGNQWTAGDVGDGLLSRQVDVGQRRGAAQRHHSPTAAGGDHGADRDAAATMPVLLDMEGGGSRGRSMAAEGAGGDIHTGGGGRRLAKAGMYDSHDGVRFFPMVGKAISLECNLTLNFTLLAAAWNVDAVDEKAMVYGFMSTTAAVVLMVAVTYQILHSSSASVAQRISLGTVGIQAISDSYLCLLHMLAGFMFNTIFSSFATTAFIYLMLFSVLEMRFLLVIWKARRPDTGMTTWEVLRREVGSLYCRFYLAMMMGLTLLLAANTTGLIIIAVISYSFWLPQIIHSVKHDSRSGLTRPYILATTFMRALLPAYFGWCPYNLALSMLPPESASHARQWRPSWPAALNAWLPPGNDPLTPEDVESWALPASSAPAFTSPAAAAQYWYNVRFTTWLLVWLGVQTVVVLLQNKLGWGPRFFVPAAFLPKRYDYHRRVRVQDGRVAPDPGATGRWRRARLGSSATEGGGAAAAAPPHAEGGAAAGLAATVRQWYQSARSALVDARETAAWFGAAFVVMLHDWYALIRARVGRAGVMRQALGARRAGNLSGVPYTQIGASDGAAAATDGSTSVEDGGGGEGAREAAAAVEEGRGGGVGPSTPPDGSGHGSDPTLDEVVTGRGDGEEDDAPIHIDCVVCMDGVTFPLRRREYMVTPCDHLFHTSCLQPWLEQKLECPTCRMQLPEP